MGSSLDTLKALTGAGSGAAPIDPTDPPVYVGPSGVTSHNGDVLVADPSRTPNDTGNTTRSDTIPASSAYLMLYEDDATRQHLGEQLYENGLINDPNNYDAINQMWKRAVDEAANFKAVGRNLTPFQVLDIMAGQSAQKQPKSRTTTSVSTDIPNAANIDATVQQMFKDNVGRAPTAAEMAKYRGMLTAKAKANPSRTTTTTTYDASGNAASSNSTTQQGMDASGLAYEAAKQVQDTKEYGTQQAALYYYNTLASVINGGH